MFANKVLQTITNTGTGAYQLNSTGTGAWKTFRSQFATAAQVAYYAENADGTVWEYGYGTLTYGTPDQISRTYLLSSTGSLIDWTSGDGTVYVMSVPWAQAMEGRWDATAGMFAPAGRKPYTAVGAGNKTVTAANAGGSFSLDTSAAARTVTLPAISAVTMGFNIEVRGLSTANGLTITPSGSDVIDHGSAGASLSVPGRYPLIIRSDGTQWRTDFDYSSVRVVKVQTFTSSGTYTPDPNMVYCIIELVGGGGGGGGTTGAGTAGVGGGGGGGGGYAMKVATAAAVGASQTVTIGTGGAGNSGAAGSNGGATSVGSLCAANGGSGGGVASSTGQGGTPGTGTTGDVLCYGTPGGSPWNGSYALGVSGSIGGSSRFGGGAVNEINVTSGRASTGLNAPGYGGGGSGAVIYDVGLARAGGTGGTGYVVITEFCRK